jgi:RNA polymerase sigma factor (TIGR02999 family)
VQSEVTQILSEFDDRPNAAEELLPLVYEELHSLARARMREERAAHTLQATALVHEAYLRLVGADGIEWESRAHFFRVAAEAMRRILIDHARKKGAQKRGGGAKGIPLNVASLAEDVDPGQFLALNDALEKLEQEDERAAEIVKLRFFTGLSVADTVRVLGLSERTVMREWKFARARLFQLLED